jgi:hypothetical protein
MKRRRVRQEFRAAVIQRWGEGDARLMWFSTDPGTAPPQICLLLASVEGRGRAGHAAIELELNDQDNSRNGLEVSSLEASRTMLRIRFKRGFGVRPGYVDALEDHPVAEILVRFALAEGDYAYLAALLAAAREDGCMVRCRPGATPRTKPTRVEPVPPR